MLKKIKFFLIILFFYSFNTYSFSENNILFIDIEYIYLNSEAGKIVNKKIQSKSNDINSELNNYQKKIQEEKKKTS